MFSLKYWKKVFLQSKFQFWALFFVIILIRFLPFFQGKTLVFGDNYSLMMPGKIFAAQWLKQGIIPLWNPYLFSGISTEMMDVNQSVFYPDTLLFIVLPAWLALNLTIISHLFIAYAGMYLLAKTWLKDHAWSLVAALLWMLSTQVTSSINNLATLQAIVWLPLLGYFGLKLDQRWSKLGFAAVVLMQFLGGYPQHVLYGIALAVLLSIFQSWHKKDFKQWFLPWVWTGVLTIGLSAVAWVPFWQALQESTRILQTESQALVGSMNPVTIVKFFLPYFFDNAADGVKWGPAWSGQSNFGLYLTWFGWLTIGSSFFIKRKALKREVWFFAGVVAFTLIFSLGGYLPGFALIQKYIPFFRIARYPSMMLIVTNVILALWTARGLQQWQVSKRLKQWLIGGSLVGIFVGLVGLIVHQWGFTNLWHMADSFVSFSLSASPFHTLDRDKIIMFEIVRNILFNSLFLFASIWLFTRKKWRLAPFILALVIGTDLVFNTQGQFFFAPKNVYDTNAENFEQLSTKLNLPNTGFQYRLLTRNLNKPYTDYGSYWEALVVRAPFSDSFVDEQGLQDFQHAANLRDGLTPNWNSALSVPVVNGYTTLLPIDYATIWNRNDNEPRINFVESIDPADPLLDEWSVRYYLVDTWFKVEEDLSAFPLVGEYDRWQILERPNALPRIRFEDGSAPELANFTENPNELNFSFENTDNQESLIIADRFDPDWQVLINGQSGSIENWQGMRKIMLQPGLNEIKMWYAPKMLKVGLVISIFSLLVAVLAYKFKRSAVK